MTKTIIRGTKVFYGEHSIRVRVVRSNSDICPYPLYIVTLQNDDETPIAVRYSLRKEMTDCQYSNVLIDVFSNSYDDNVRIIRKEKDAKEYFLIGSKLLGMDYLYKLDTVEPDRVSVDTVFVDTIEPDRVTVDGTTEGKIYCSLLTCQIPEENYTNCDNEDSFSELCYRID